MSIPLKLGVFCYLPPLALGHTKSFWANFTKFKTKNDLHVFGYNLNLPGVINLKNDPEFYKGKGKHNRLALPNAVFWVAVKMAHMWGYSHFLFVEADCRIGCDNWDEIVWQEYLSIDPLAILSGSPRVFNPGAGARETLEAYERFVARTHPRAFPIPIAANARLNEKHQQAVFPNGALAVYQMEWLWKVFGDEITNKFSEFVSTTEGWDYEIGIRFFNEFGAGCYDRMTCLTKAFSDFGDLHFTEQERQEMLNSGQITCVHQIKSDWIGPDSPTKLIETPTWKPTPPSIKVVAGLIWVTHRKDLPWFEISARSYAKFARGWSKVVCVVPNEDVEAFRPICEANGITVVGGEQWTDKPFNWHQAQKCCADEYLTDCNVIYHCDADTVFAQPCTPYDWIMGDKILMPYTPYDAFLKRPEDPDEMMTFMGLTGHKADYDRGQYNWRFAVEYGLGRRVERECMGWAPIAHYAPVYAKTREVIAQRFEKQGFFDYVRSCRDTHPQTFCEFNTLGAVAHLFFENKYEWYNLVGRSYPFYGKLIQSWSHNGMDCEKKLQGITSHDYGPQINDPTINTPRKLFTKLGLLV